MQKELDVESRKGLGKTREGGQGSPWAVVPQEEEGFLGCLGNGIIYFHSHVYFRLNIQTRFCLISLVSFVVEMNRPCENHSSFMLFRRVQFPL